MKKLLKVLDGHKTIISSVIMHFINSDYFVKLIVNPDLYMVIQSASAILFAGSLIHHVKKMGKKL